MSSLKEQVAQLTLQIQVLQNQLSTQTTLLPADPPPPPAMTKLLKIATPTHSQVCKMTLTTLRQSAACAYAYKGPSSPMRQARCCSSCHTWRVEPPGHGQCTRSSRSLAPPRHQWQWMSLKLRLTSCSQIWIERWWCRQDNNLLYDLSLEPSFRAKMHYQNCLKSSLSSIKQSPEIILRGTKHRVSEVPQTLSQLFHKILIIHMIPMV